MLTPALDAVVQRLENAARQYGRPAPRLLAVSKRQPATAVAGLAGAGQRAFGENYVQEAVEKQAELRDADLEWHLIGHLQTNKARDAAAIFGFPDELKFRSCMTLFAAADSALYGAKRRGQTVTASDGHHSARREPARGPTTAPTPHMRPRWPVVLV